MSIPKNKYQLEYLARMNIIYHERREGRFSRLIRWTSFLSILLASVTVASLSQALLPSALRASGAQAAVLFGLLVAIGNAASLAFNWPAQQALHARFKAKWTALSLEAGLLDEANRAAFEVLCRQLVALNADEPAPNERALKGAADEADAIFGKAN